jgi:aspartokinase/homoserine dehydrogenase 1
MNCAVHKFGGSTLVDINSIDKILLLTDHKNVSHSIYVVSAFYGVTDKLQRLIDLAESGESLDQNLSEISSIHEKISSHYLKSELDIGIESFKSDIQDIRDILASVKELHKVPFHSQEKILGYGEIWSAQLLTKLFAKHTQKRVKFLDARDFLVTENTDMGVSPIWSVTQSKFNGLVDFTDIDIYILTGFISLNKDGIQSTLGRNGTDFTASIIANLVQAKSLTFWKDVSGVMSADPRIVKDSKVISSLTYDECMELSYYGAKILHPKTMAPAMEFDIPIYIKNVFNPKDPGTIIQRSEDKVKLIVKGVTGIEKIALVTLAGAGMIGVPGTASRLFDALRRGGISVLMISQGSSEHSICCAVREQDASHAKSLIEKEFRHELYLNLISNIKSESECAILAIVGNGMAGTHGVSAKFFSSLGNAAINIKAIAQGSSERNISVVIKAEQLNKAINAVHSSFYLSEKSISLGIIGIGNVGKELISQIKDQLNNLHNFKNINLKIRAIANSKFMKLSEEINSNDIDELSKSQGENYDMQLFTNHIKADHLPHSIIVDCTASEKIANSYQRWMNDGMHVVTANKIAHSGNYENYRELKQISKNLGFQFLYEATVGAGLPVIKSLQNLINSGDEILEISGIFSGTLGYLFNLYDGNNSFSEILIDAKNKGFTEPDPRLDLSGMDVARKAVILARECLHAIEINDIVVQNLVPQSMQKQDLDSFLTNVTELDSHIDAIHSSLIDSQDYKLRYVANLNLEKRKYTVGLQAIKHPHPFLNLNLTDNIFQFRTKRYNVNPLNIIGPGAGPEVTASGLFADIITIADSLGNFKPIES